MKLIKSRDLHIVHHLRPSLAHSDYGCISVNALNWQSSLEACKQVDNV